MAHRKLHAVTLRSECAFVRLNVENRAGGGCARGLPSGFRASLKCAEALPSGVPVGGDSAVRVSAP